MSHAPAFNTINAAVVDRLKWFIEGFDVSLRTSTMDGGGEDKKTSIIFLG